jgi:hypothetical protein
MITMKLTTWLKQRAKLSEEYGNFSARGSHLVFLYDQEKVSARDLLENARRLDTAYLAICTLDRVEPTPGE